MPEYEENFRTTNVDLSTIEAAARDFSLALDVFGLECFDVYDEMLQQLDSLAMKELGRYACGVNAGICIGYSTLGEIKGEVLSGDIAQFVGTFDRAAQVLSPITPLLTIDARFEDAPVPALLFEPIDILPDNENGLASLCERYNGAAMVYHRVA